ncbi:MAG: hypothetical protein AB7H71_13410 [Alphaproteobacteria bacterium]
MDFDVIAYALFGLSLSVSAAQLGGWLLTAHPRTILQAGRVSAVCLAVATPLALLWLVLTGRSTLAMMLAAFAMPVVIESARRWSGLFGTPGLFRRREPPAADIPVAPDRPGRREPGCGGVSPDLAAQCALMLQLYLEQTKQAAERRPGARLIASREPADRRERMSVEEALEVLGLPAAASAEEIRAARVRLSAAFAPENGGTRYFAAKIDEAEGVLLGALPPPRSVSAFVHGEIDDRGGPSRV